MTKIHADAGGLTAHMDRSARRTPPYHASGREFIMNSADAGATRFQVDGFTLPDGRQVMRLSDNGSGMTPEQLRQYMLTLFLSGSDRAANHGMGARFAALPFNPAGVVWASRSDEAEAMLTVHKDVDGNYASLEEVIDDGKLTDLFDPEDAYPGIFKHLDSWKAKTGTVVLLLGDGESNTWDNDHHREWGNYAARRWWEWPKGLAKLPGNAIPAPGPIYGARTWPLGHLLEKKAVSQGVVPLSGDVEVRWFVLPYEPDRAKSDGSAVNARRLQSSTPWSLAPSGRTAIHGGEVWDFRGASTDGATALSQFGIWNGKVAGRVHLAVHLPLDGYIVDEERLHLTTPGGGHLPWTKWGEEFAHNMPVEIEDLLAGEKPPTSDLNDAILKQLDPDWMKWAGETDAIRRTKSGTLTGAPSTKIGGSGTGTPTGPPSGKPKKAPKGAKLLAPDTSGSGLGTEVKTADIPDVMWLNDGPDAEATDGVTRPKGPTVYSWLSGSHLFIRRTHPAVIQSKEKFAAPMPPIKRPLVDEAVEKAFGIELAAKIVHMRILARKGAAGWSEGDVAAHLAENMTLDGMMLGLNATDRLVQTELRK